MPKINHDTKEKILKAAESVFHENGFKGTRTTLIAQRAGISRTMLHYYFRTKEDLFQEVLRASFGLFIQHAQKLFQSEQNLKTLINNFIDTISDIFKAKPGLPSFLINIVNESPELLIELPFIQEEDLPALLERHMKIERANGTINPNINGEDLLLNIYGMCVMPYLGSPIIKFKENRSAAAMETFIDQRRAMIKDFVWKGIQN